MKKMIKNPIFTFIMGALIFGSGSVFAYNLLANNIGYSPKDLAWNVNTVSEAIDSLYISKTSDNYSTEEKKVGTWIDGTPIYQKTINLGIMPNATDIEVPHNISNLKMVVKFDGVMYNGSSQTIPLPRIETGSANSVYNTSLDILNDKIRIGTQVNLSNLVGYLTIQYTKTTDSIPSNQSNNNEG